ncbi:carboxymuconolactone decarboxylase family protein [Prescottella agglutinans]|uniref:Alkylhydroperoxidase/carboxymuconolactone decarboxylase family protein YurZ n=1 Tax=Prescottella agglutinans TaxID=1644129 RepID=A0ABT6MDS4_9NOCA|nr:carboxymuconolactone decarboxylase family protein [Prescottella agglutinans]MDH6282469.1 alkylhydroperoxidase/carboxymuconolactone decarboxylase family protein YurZ [Prescottella agglutinans]
MTTDNGSLTTFVEGLKANGSWNPLWDSLLEFDPEWTEHYMRAAAQTYQSKHLSPQTVQLLCLALDVSCTHLYAPGVRRHIQDALKLGVTPQEIFEVLKLATTVGLHSVNIGLPLLLEEIPAQDPGRDQATTD